MFGVARAFVASTRSTGVVGPLHWLDDGRWMAGGDWRAIDQSCEVHARRARERRRAAVRVVIFERERSRKEHGRGGEGVGPVGVVVWMNMTGCRKLQVVKR